MVYIVSMFLRVLVLAHPVCPSIKGHYMVVVFVLRVLNTHS